MEADAADTQRVRALHLLLQAGRCDELQGYFFSHPLEAGALQRMHLNSACGDSPPKENGTWAFAR